MGIHHDLAGHFLPPTDIECMHLTFGFWGVKHPPLLVSTLHTSRHISLIPLVSTTFRAGHFLPQPISSARARYSVFAVKIPPPPAQLCLTHLPHPQSPHLPHPNGPPYNPLMLYSTSHHYRVLARSIRFLGVKSPLPVIFTPVNLCSPKCCISLTTIALSTTPACCFDPPPVSSACA